MPDSPPLKLYFFTLPGCAACTAMKKAGTVEKFIAKHPNVTMHDVVLAEPEDDSEDAEPVNTPENKMADAYDISATPTLLFKHPQYGEVGREEGGMNLKMIEELYEVALARVEFESKQ